MWAHFALLRFSQLAITFVLATMVVFILLQLAPGDPATMLIDAESGTGQHRDSIAHWRAMRGLDQPLWTQYLDWLGRFCTLNFGQSFVDERPVRTIIHEAMPRTVLLAGTTLVVAYLVSIPLGIAAAVRCGSWFDRSLTTVLIWLYSVPVFWTAVVAIVLFAGGEYVRWFPAGGLQSSDLDVTASWFTRLLDLAWHLVLPVACMACPAVARTTRFQRAALLEVLDQDFIRTARAKGLSEIVVIWRHGFPNSLAPMVTLLSLDLPWILAGSVVVERVFSIRGMGMVMFEAVLQRDYPVMMGVVAVGTVATMAALLLGDLTLAWLDPRTRLGATTR